MARMSIKAQKAEQARVDRLQNLNDRANFILQMPRSGRSDEDMKDDYGAKFGSFLFSNDVYEENAIICSELGCDNLLDA